MNQRDAIFSIITTEKISHVTFLFLFTEISNRRLDKIEPYSTSTNEKLIFPICLSRLLADEGGEKDRFAGEAAVGSRPDLVPQLLEGRTVTVSLQFRRQGDLRQR